MEIQFVRHRKIYFLFSGIMILLAVIFLFIWGLNLGIEFTGGNLLELKFKENLPPINQIREELKELNLGQIILQKAENNALVLKFQSEKEEARNKIIKKLKEKGYQFEELRYESVGPAIGKELREKALILIILSLLAILIYIALAFRSLKWPFKSWVYGSLAVLALAHDILITLGFISFLGFRFSTQVTVPILVALLTIAGYSVNDTVVVLDRIRENLMKTSKALPYSQLVNLSLNQVLGRSLSTSFTTIFVLLALIFWGAKTLFDFALVLAFGIFIGTYSSIFLVSPLLIELYQKKYKDE